MNQIDPEIRELLETTRKMILDVLVNTDYKTGEIQATHINYKKWDEVYSKLCYATRMEGE